MQCSSFNQKNFVCRVRPSLPGYRIIFIWQMFMQGWGCGRCKHCAAFLYQLCEYKTCTDILQKWHVPGESEIMGQIFFFKINIYKS